MTSLTSLKGLQIARELPPQHGLRALRPRGGVSEGRLVLHGRHALLAADAVAGLRLLREVPVASGRLGADSLCISVPFRVHVLFIFEYLYKSLISLLSLSLSTYVLSIFHSCSIHL